VSQHRQSAAAAAVEGDEPRLGGRNGRGRGAVVGGPPRQVDEQWAPQRHPSRRDGRATDGHCVDVRGRRVLGQLAHGEHGGAMRWWQAPCDWGPDDDNLETVVGAPRRRRRDRRFVSLRVWRWRGAGAMASELLLAATAADDSDEALRLVAEDRADVNVQ